MTQNARIRFPDPRGTSLSQILAQCAPGATLEIAPGRYDEPLIVDRPITIRGSGELTRLSTRGKGSVITVRAGEGSVRLESLAIEDGEAEEGGGLSIESGTVTIHNVHLRRCRARRGGAIHVAGGKVQAGLLRFLQMDAERGAAIRVSKRGSLELRDAQISQCAASFGGSIAVDDAGRLVLQAVTIAKTRASESAGGQALFIGGSRDGAPILSLHRVRLADAPMGRPVVQDRALPGLIQVSSCDLPRVVLDEPGVVDLGGNHWR